LTDVEVVYAGNLAGSEAACEESLNGAVAAIEALSERLEADART
jgi:hypothetical protein